VTTKFAVMLATIVALAVKVGTWAIYGPVTFNDTVLYEAFANLLLQDDWSWQYDFFNETVPVTGLRTIGYPSVLAVAQTLVGDEWRHAVIGVQIAVSLLSVATATHWACRLTALPWLALFTGLTLALGQSALYDTALLPDSLFSSLAIMILCALSVPREANGRRARLSEPPFSAVWAPPQCACLELTACISPFYSRHSRLSGWRIFVRADFCPL